MFEITSYDITSKKIPKSFHGYKIAHLSDLHGALHGAGNEELIRAIDQAQPDLIVMTGDMMDHRGGAVKNALDLCRKLAKRYPVYYAIGNHEQTLAKPVWQDAVHELCDMDVRILDNQKLELTVDGRSIDVYGLTTPMVYYKDPLGEYERGVELTKGHVTDLLGVSDKARFKLLLAHNPLYFPAYYNWGADLTLSGHVHGGIIRIPGLGGLLSPDMTFFPKYDAGHFKRNGRHLIVSRGLGNNFLFRICNKPELIFITLTST